MSARRRPTPLNHVPVMLAEVLATLAPRDGAHLSRRHLRRRRLSRRRSSMPPRCTRLGHRPRPGRHRPRRRARRPLPRPAASAARPLRRHAGAAGRPRRRARSTASCSTSASPPSSSTSPAAASPSARDGPLDMRMAAGRPDRRGPRQHPGRSRSWPTRSTSFGEERLSRRIAARHRRRAAPKRRSPPPRRLAAIIRRVVPRDRSGIDPATRSFQALRIAVNDELGEIERGLAAAAGLLAPGGRLVVVVVPLARGPAGEALHGRTPPGARPAPPATTRPGCSARAAARIRPAHAAGRAARRRRTDANPRARSARLRAHRTPAYTWPTRDAA